MPPADTQSPLRVRPDPGQRRDSRLDVRPARLPSGRSPYLAAAIRLIRTSVLAPGHSQTSAAGRRTDYDAISALSLVVPAALRRTSGCLPATGRRYSGGQCGHHFFPTSDDPDVGRGED